MINTIICPSILILCFIHLLIFLMISHGFQTSVVSTSGSTTINPQSPSSDRSSGSSKYIASYSTIHPIETSLIGLKETQNITNTKHLRTSSIRSVRLHSNQLWQRRLRRQEPRSSPSSLSTKNVFKKYSFTDPQDITTDVERKNWSLSLEHIEDGPCASGNSTHGKTHNDNTFHFVESRFSNHNPQNKEFHSKTFLIIFILLIILIASGISSIFIFVTNTVSYILKKLRKRKKRSSFHNNPARSAVRNRSTVIFQNRRLLDCPTTEKSYQDCTDERNIKYPSNPTPPSISVKSFAQTTPTASGSLENVNSAFSNDLIDSIYICYSNTKPQLSHGSSSFAETSKIVHNPKQGGQQINCIRTPIHRIPFQLNITKPYDEKRGDDLPSPKKLFDKFEDEKTNQIDNGTFEISERNDKTTDASISLTSPISQFSQYHNNDSNRISQAELYQVQVSSNKLEIVIKSTKKGPKIYRIEPTSPLINLVRIGDIIIDVDGVDTAGMDSGTLSKWFKKRPANAQTTITLFSNENYGFEDIQRTLSAFNSLT